MEVSFIKSWVFNFKSGIFIGFLIFSSFISLSVLAQKTPWVAPKDEDNLKNPLSGNAQSLAGGKTLYIANCGPCHGEKGKGDGPAAQGLNPKPADHTSAAVQGQTDGAIFWKLAEGRTPMPGYKKIFTDQQRWGLLNYIRSLAKVSKK